MNSTPTSPPTKTRLVILSVLRLLIIPVVTVTANASEPGTTIVPASSPDSTSTSTTPTLSTLNPEEDGYMVCQTYVSQTCWDTCYQGCRYLEDAFMCSDRCSGDCTKQRCYLVI